MYRDRFNGNVQDITFIGSFGIKGENAMKDCWQVLVRASVRSLTRSCYFLIYYDKWRLMIFMQIHVFMSIVSSDILCIFTYYVHFPRVYFQSFS